jgi:hypothetical protein
VVSFFVIIEPNELQQSHEGFFFQQEVSDTANNKTTEATNVTCNFFITMI